MLQLSNTSATHNHVGQVFLSLEEKNMSASVRFNVKGDYSFSFPNSDCPFSHQTLSKKLKRNKKEKIKEMSII